MITVEVRLLASLRKYLPSGASSDVVEVQLPDETSVGELIERLGIPGDRAAMVMCGDERLENSSVLRDGQAVSLLPPLAGGA